jgi:hypothetical protein
MMKRFILLAVVVLSSACQTAPLGPTPPLPAGVSFGGGDGSSFETAILVHAQKEDSGVQSEYAWLAQHYPGYRMGQQSLQTHGGREYDVLEITTRDGTRKEVYFDISEFSQKF